MSKRNKNPELYDLRSDIMRYKKNSASFWLCILAIIFDVAMFLIIYKETNCVPNWALGIDLVLNIVIILAFFLTAEKTKAYSVSGSKTSYVLGVIQVVRIFWIPLTYFKEYLSCMEQINAGAEIVATGLNTGKFIWCFVLLVLSGLSSVFAGIICQKKAKRLQEHLKMKEAK